MLVERIAELTTYIRNKTNAMIDARKTANIIENEREKAIAYNDAVFPFLDEIRCAIDQLELIVDDEMWTMPKYREILFMR